MKDYIQEQYPQYERGGMTYKILRKVVREAWDSISIKQLNELTSRRGIFRRRGFPHVIRPNPPH